MLRLTNFLNFSRTYCKLHLFGTRIAAENQEKHSAKKSKCIENNPPNTTKTMGKTHSTQIPYVESERNLIALGEFYLCDRSVVFA